MGSGRGKPVGWFATLVPGNFFCEFKHLFIPQLKFIFNFFKKKLSVPSIGIIKPTMSHYYNLTYKYTNLQYLKRIYLFTYRHRRKIPRRSKFELFKYL